MTNTHNAAYVKWRKGHDDDIRNALSGPLAESKFLSLYLMKISVTFFSNLLAGVIYLLLITGQVNAHHSFAMFDNNNHIRLHGIVTHYQWTNPHVYIELEVKQEDGSTRRWTIECANPGILSRNGWKHNMVKEGDEVTVVIAPLRNGKTGALLKQVKLPDGTKIENGGPAGPPKISIETGEPLE